MSKEIQVTKSELIPKFEAALRAGVPITAVNTPDQPATQMMLYELLSADNKTKHPIFSWDFVRGVHHNNPQALEVLGALGAEDPINAGDPMGALKLALKFPPHSVVFIFTSNRFIHTLEVCQALLNLRDEFKANGSMVVLLGTDIKLPAEISTDVVQWTEPLPNDAQLTVIVQDQIEQANGQLKKAPTAEQIKRAAESLRGCSAFGAEQLAAMSLRQSGIDLDTLHTQAKAIIEQTPGLTFERGKETFDDIGGLQFAKEFGRRMFSGPKAPAVIVRVEELEKAISGSKGDLSGTSGDALQVLLSQMEDNDWSGMLAYGCPGAGKSLFAKSLANTHGAKAICFDINSCKGSLVGQSEQQIRRAMQVIHTLGGDRVFFVASCNAMDFLPAALQRRFRSGTWFFNSPSESERKDIWNMNRKKYGIEDTDLPDEDDFTGADIRNICEMSYMLKCSLQEGKKFVVPLKVQAPQDIANCRKMATGRFTDAALGGVFGSASVSQASKGRKVNLQ